MPAAVLSSGVTAHTHHEAPGSKMLNSPARGKRPVRRDSACQGMVAGRDISGLLFSISPQYYEVVVVDSATTARKGESSDALTLTQDSSYFEREKNHVWGLHVRYRVRPCVVWDEQ